MILPKRFTLKVGAKDIENGIREDPRNCPIAIAVRKKFKIFDEDDVSVAWSVRIKDTRYSLTNRANIFVGMFDTGKKVKPTSFTFTQV